MSFYSFDQEGRYLLCSGLDSHLYVLDGRPSAKFSVLGYIGKNMLQRLMQEFLSFITNYPVCVLLQRFLAEFCHFPHNASTVVRM